MNDLIKRAIEVQGGLDRWRKFYTVTSRLGIGGFLWAMKGHEGALDGIDVKVDLLDQKTSHILSRERHTSYTPNRVAIEEANGTVIEELFNPRASFLGHSAETPWSQLQLAYFAGYATWNYFNMPWQLLRPGFEFKEIETWEENNETWRRLIITWPKDIHTHSTEQTLYFDKDGYIRRLDYRVEISANVPSAHYLSEYKEISGIKMATRRTVYRVDKNNKTQFDSPAIVTIDFKDIKFE